MIQIIHIDGTTSKTGMALGEGRLHTQINATRDAVLFDSVIGPHLLHRTQAPRSGMHISFAHNRMNHQHRNVHTVINRVKGGLFKPLRPGETPPSEDTPVSFGRKLLADTDGMPPTVATALLMLLPRPFAVVDQIIEREVCGLMDARFSATRHVPGGPVILKLAGSVTPPRALLESVVWELTATEALARRAPSLNAAQALKAIYGAHGEIVMRDIELTAEKNGWNNKNGVTETREVHSLDELHLAYADLIETARQPRAFDTSALTELVRDTLIANTGQASRKI